MIRVWSTSSQNFSLSLASISVRSSKVSPAGGTLRRTASWQLVWSDSSSILMLLSTAYCKGPRYFRGRQWIRSLSSPCIPLPHGTPLPRPRSPGSLQPRLWRVSIREASTATMPTPLAILMAFGCAPLIPPRPLVTNRWRTGLRPEARPGILRPAFRMVLEGSRARYLCGPMYIQPPAVICP